MFNSCNRLVGGTDGFVPPQTSGASVCKLGAGGVLTDPNNDARTWFWAHYYADGEGVLTATSTPDATRDVVASGRICAIGKYVGLGFTPWDGMTGPTHRQHLTSATFAADMATFSYLNLNYLFYSCTNLASFGHLGFVHREFLSSNVVLKQEHPCEIPWTNPWTNHPARSAVFRERVVCRKSRHTTIDLQKRCILG